MQPELASLVQPFHRPPVKSVQGFQQMPGDQSSINPVGRPIMHMSATLQASGEARYTDDIPRVAGELYAGLVLSTHAHAKISVDWAPVLSVDGVWGHVTVQDVPGSNKTGLFNDEEVFADGKVTHFGQVIGMVLAKNQIIAQRAARLVEVSYSDLPAIITIEVRISSRAEYSLFSLCCVWDAGCNSCQLLFPCCPSSQQGRLQLGLPR